MFRIMKHDESKHTITTYVLYVLKAISGIFIRKMYIYIAILSNTPFITV